MALGVTGLGLAPHSAALACVGLYGAGMGLGIPAMNLLMAQHSPGREAGALSILNMSWCIGAVAAPPLLAGLLQRMALGPVLGGLGALAAICGVAAFVGMRSPGADAKGKPGGSGKRRGAVLARDAKMAAVWAGAFVFVYVGLENGLTGWLPLFAQRNAGAGAGVAASFLSIFWTAMMTVRFGAGAFAGRLEPRRMLRLGVGIAIPALALLVLTRTPLQLAVCAVAAGLGMGTIFPSAMALFQRRAGEASGQLIGYVFAGCSCGAAAIPWLVGVVSSVSGSLAWGLAATAVCALALIPLERRL